MTLVVWAIKVLAIPARCIAISGLALPKRRNSQGKATWLLRPASQLEFGSSLVSVFFSPALYPTVDLRLDLESSQKTYASKQS